MSQEPAPQVKLKDRASLKSLNPARQAKDPDADLSVLEALAGSSVAVDRLLARNPNASVALLEKLAHSSDKTTRNHVVVHPNTPTEVLVKLAHQFPASFFKNPAFDWLLIEDPGLMQRIGGNVLGSLLKRPDCPQCFLNWAVVHGTEKERLAVAMNPVASVKALRKLVRQKGPVAEAAQAHEKLALGNVTVDPVAILDDEVRKELAVLYTWQARVAWKKGFIGPAQWAALPLEARLETLDIEIDWLIPAWVKDEDVCLQLIAYGNWEIRRKLAAKAKCPGSVLEALAADRDLRQTVAQNPACPALVLEALAKAKKGGARAEVASNPACPVAVLETLSKKRESGVRAAVAGNSACPAALLEVLGNDKRRVIRMALAQHPLCPLEQLEWFAGDTDASLRESVAKNPACPAALLEALASDKRLSVCAAVAGNPGCPLALLESLAIDKNDAVRACLAGNPACPPHVLKNLSGDRAPKVRVAVAGNPASLGLVESLAMSGNQDVLLALVGRRDIHESRRAEFLSSLIRTRGRKRIGPIAKKVAHLYQGDSIPISIAIQLARRQYLSIGEKYGAAPALLTELEALSGEALAVAMIEDFELLRTQPQASLLARLMGIDPQLPLTSGNNFANAATSRLLWLNSKTTPPDMLARQSKSTAWRDRLAIAMNLSCPTIVRESLKGDPHRAVAAGARWGTRQHQIMVAQQEVTIGQSTAPDLGTLTLEVCRRLGQMERLPHFEGIGEFVRGPWKCHIHLVVHFRFAAGHSACPVDLLEVLAKDKSMRIRRQVAGNRACPVSVLEVLAKNKSMWIRSYVAENPACPAALLLMLARDKSKDVRCGVAENRNCPVARLEMLAKDKSEDVRRAVARNPACPVALIELLAKDKEEWVRQAVTENPACPAAVLEVLAKDKDSWGRGAFAGNSVCTVTLQEVLAMFWWSDRRAVAKNPACPVAVLEVLAKDRVSLVRGEVAGNSACPVALLEMLAKDKKQDVRRTVTKNPVCPVALLEVLAKDREPSVRRAVAENSACPVALLEVLAKDGNVEVSLAVVTHQAVSPECLDQIVQTALPWPVWLAISHPSVTRAQLQRWAADDRLLSILRHGCVTHPRFPANEQALIDEIRRLAEAPAQPPERVSENEWALAFRALRLYPSDKQAISKTITAKDWLQRAAATFSPDIQPHQLKLLLDDSEEMVRRLAAERLRQRVAAKS